ncbi:hypothetical protein MJA45_13485 [Paenibacillus aurantius]|uniref:Uncharacterized protein n=1 Tax=Paenibacillus aurantius TaxID=2918900 RepID=A0AA96LIJ7_9BACL|nr:hypothetical protein [Paenibacillus aurantius]WNQ13984.1 hypothetical protein MJA45_13485 [Paenibacillus aurantius]
MGKLLIIICAITFALAGCSKDTKAYEQNGIQETKISPTAKVTEGDFIYRLVSEKPIYNKGEKVNVYSELEYVGNEKEIRIAHSASPFSFPMKEKTRGFDIVYMMEQPRIETVLKKGEPLREYYRGGGGYGSQDPKEYIDFIEAIAEASQKGTLPRGEYEVSGVAEFQPLDGLAGELKSMKAKIEFNVE